MLDPVQISLPASVFARLQRLAVPLVDDSASVVEKLLNHWEENPPKFSSYQDAEQRTSELSIWRSPRGDDELPVGVRLRAMYLGKRFEACVEHAGIRFDGEVYKDLSPAAVAVKKQLGRIGRTASTNGRTFWKIESPTSGKWIEVKALRPERKIDADAVLAKFRKLPQDSGENRATKHEA